MESIKNDYVKRTQKEYSISFKLSVVWEIEQGNISVTGAQRKYGIQRNTTVMRWLRKYGTFYWENQMPSNMPKSEDQKVLALEQKIKLLKNRKLF